MTAAAVDYEMSKSLPNHPGIEICGIASAVPEHCIDQAVARDIILANAPEFRSHQALFQNTGVKDTFLLCAGGVAHGSTRLVLTCHHVPNGRGQASRRRGATMRRPSRHRSERGRSHCYRLDNRSCRSKPRCHAGQSPRSIGGRGAASGLWPGLRWWSVRPCAMCTVGAFAADGECSVPGRRAVHDQLPNERPHDKELHFGGIVR